MPYIRMSIDQNGGYCQDRGSHGLSLCQPGYVNLAQIGAALIYQGKSVSEYVHEWYEKYRWIQLLDQGGMGDVYLAENKTDDFKKCVIKQLRSEDRSEEEISEGKRLFEREVALLKELKHPGIVRFFDNYISPEGRYFLVMDYVKGNNLETMIQNHGKFAQDDVIKIGIQICEVLEYLHEHEPPVIYRDLKPSNLMLTPDGHIIFIDFGIARNLMPKEAATRVITAGYSPPEQYFGRPEFRSDLYALGATMAHLVTGTRPRPLITSVPSDHKHVEILPSLDALIVSLTAHSPSDRPVSARLVRHQLYKIYQEIYEDFEIPTEVFAHENLGREEQFISQKIMQSGLKAAKSASKPLPHAKGPEQTYFTDEEMPSAIWRIVSVGLQKLSSTKLPKYVDDAEEFRTAQDDNEGPSRSATTGKTASFDNLRTRQKPARTASSDGSIAKPGKPGKPESKQSFWRSLFKRGKKD